MHPVLLEVFGIKIFAYGFFMALGILCSVAVSAHYAQKTGLSKDSVYDLAFVAVIFSILGARALYVILNLPYYLQNPVEIFLINRGGLVFYGGLIGGFFAAYVYLKRTKQNFWKMGDLIFTGIPIGQAFGRIGCFFNGCCFGHPTKESFGITFPMGSLPFEHYDEFVCLHPVQLYSSFGNFVIFLILCTVFDDRKYDGQIMLTYGILYSLARFFTEFFRGDVQRFGLLTFAQYISMVIFVFSVILAIKMGRKNKVKNLK